MKKFEIVITGGPCAGKSTAIDILKEELTKKGFKVIVSAETATELVLEGIYPWEFEAEVFRSILISRAHNKEETIREALKYIKQDTIVIYDRGILDVKAYMKSEEFEKEFKKYNITEKNIIKNYDAVFHLVTTANGAEEFYTLSNNGARKETLEEARYLDRRTIECWSSHKNFKIIDNSTNFEGKISRLLDEINLVLNI